MAYGATPKRNLPLPPFFRQETGQVLPDFPQTTAARSLFPPDLFFPHRKQHTQKAKSERHFSRTDATSPPGSRDGTSASFATGLNRAGIEMRGADKAAAGLDCLCRAKNASTADGFRTPQGIAFALFHAMGRLPESEVPHRFRKGARYQSNAANRYLSKRSGKHVMNEPV